MKGTDGVFSLSAGQNNQFGSKNSSYCIRSSDGVVCCMYYTCFLKQYVKLKEEGFIIPVTSISLQLSFTLSSLLLCACWLSHTSYVLSWLLCNCVIVGSEEEENTTIS